MGILPGDTTLNHVMEKGNEYGKKGKRMLVYGRRKTGKTFLIKLVRKPDLHLVVTRGGNVIRLQSEGFVETLNYKKAVEIVPTKKCLFFG